MKTVFAHRYKYSHDKRRAKLKKLLKKGKATLISENSEGWTYRVEKEIKL